MANVIRHKRGTSDPVAGDFNDTAELLINTTDGGLFTKTDGGSVVEIGAGCGNFKSSFPDVIATDAIDAGPWIDRVVDARSLPWDLASGSCGCGDCTSLVRSPDSRAAVCNCFRSCSPADMTTRFLGLAPISTRRTPASPWALYR